MKIYFFLNINGDDEVNKNITILNRRTIFFKTSLGFLFVILIIYLMSIFIFRFSSQTLLIRENDSLKKQIGIYFNEFESELNRIDLAQTELLADYDVNMLMLSNSDSFATDLTNRINRVIERLNVLKNSSTIINMSSLYLPNFEIKLNAKGTQGSYIGFDKKKLEEILFKYKLNSKITFIDNDIYILSKAFYDREDFNNLPVLFETQLSKTNIIKNINQFNFDSESKSFLIFEENQEILTSETIGNLSEISQLADQLKTADPVKINRFELAGIKYIGIYFYSSYLNASYLQLIPEKAILSYVHDLNNIFLIVSIIVFLSVIIYTFLIYFLFKNPMDTLVKAFTEVENGDLSLQIQRKQQDEFTLVYNSFNTMVAKIKTLIDEVYMQKILNQKSELRQLQSQINPHFLYNSFFILRKRITGKTYEEAEQFCEMLGQYFKYITQNYNDYSTLNDEVKHAKIYAKIQGARFSSRIEIIFPDLPQKFHEIIVPKLIMQPILENAFKYSLEQKVFDGKLRISYEEDKLHLNIHIDDNGESFTSNTDSINLLQQLFTNHNEIKEPSGLINIHKRLQLFFDEQSGISVSINEWNGLRVTLKLHLQGGNPDVHNSHRG
jgi:two-component system sensor histidine kinase YesM